MAYQFSSRSPRSNWSAEEALRPKRQNKHQHQKDRRDSPARANDGNRGCPHHADQQPTNNCPGHTADTAEDGCLKGVKPRLIAKLIIHGCGMDAGRHTREATQKATEK